MTAKPLPLLAEYPRLVRSLGYAFIWETWPDTPTRPARRHDRRSRVRYDCDVLIVGSGAGGATTAAMLAEAGLDVLVVEEGPWVDAGRGRAVLARADGPPVPRPAASRWRSACPSIAYTEGRCAGGGTEVNSGLYRRPPAEMLDRWRREYAIADFDTDDIEAICDEVEAALQRADRARRAHRGQRGAPPRRRAARLAPRRDPALDDLPRAGRRASTASARA